MLEYLRFESTLRISSWNVDSKAFPFSCINPRRARDGLGAHQTLPVSTLGLGRPLSPSRPVVQAPCRRSSGRWAPDGCTGQDPPHPGEPHTGLREEGKTELLRRQATGTLGLLLSAPLTCLCAGRQSERRR